MKCNAGWYELNISAPDNQVSACCYYSGPRDEWSDEYRDLDFYWNSANFQTLRRANIHGVANSGCEGCYFFRNKSAETQYFAQLISIDENATPLQKANWKLAFEEFEANREILTATPLRYYINFGFACNLSCIHCHQVPRRKTNGRQASSDVLTKWREHFKSGLEVCAIGGEPFALIEALKFIRGFVDDEELKDVRLTIFTNGTLHHRHMETLVKKRKLSLCISLDSIGEAYEYIRVDGSWEQVAKNILDFIETGKRLNLDWKLSVASCLMKAGIPKLPELAEWCGSHDLPVSFYEVISARGVEKAIADQNVLTHPLLVRDIPGWKDYFTEAASIFRRYKMGSQAGSMEFFRDLIAQRLEKLVSVERNLNVSTKSSSWTSLFDQDVRQLETIRPFLYGTVSQPPIVKHKGGWFNSGYLAFQPTDLKDHLATVFTDLPNASGPRSVRITWWWPAKAKDTQKCLIDFQDQNYRQQWDIDFQRNTSDDCVQRYIILGENSKQYRLVLSALDAQEPVILPKRIKVEFRYEEPQAPISHQNDLVQINAAS